MYRDLILVYFVRIPYCRNLDKSAETRYRTLFLNIVFKCFEGLSLKSRQKLRKFELFRNFFFILEVTMIATDLWNVWWTISEPCADSSTFDRFVFTSLLKDLNFSHNYGTQIMSVNLK